MKKDLKICPFPFSRLELGHTDEKYVPCCAAWLTDEYHQLIPEETIDEPRTTYPTLWNSTQAQELRASILDGSYRYCKLDRCNKPQISLIEVANSSGDYFETPISKANLTALANDQLEMPEGPSSLSLASDLKCNLKCPTCRDDYIVKDINNREKYIAAELEYVNREKEFLEVIKMSNSGEALFSKEQRELIKSINRYDFPRLNYIYLITNGLLFNQKTYDELLPGSSFIRKVTLSIDAGDEETYAVTRGGNWKQLLRNLHWISQMRERNQFLTVSYNFVLRKANYKSLEAFIELAREHKADKIEFVMFDNWNDLYDTKLNIGKIYESEAIHLPHHPEHHNLIKILKKYKKDSDITINIDGLNLD